jgi:hypothetical protein
VSGCTEDLPAGWEGAEHVTKLTQSECAGNAYEGDSSATFLPGRRKLTLEYEHAHFRCQQEVEGFYKQARDFRLPRAAIAGFSVRIGWSAGRTRTFRVGRRGDLGVTPAGE